VQEEKNWQGVDFAELETVLFTWYQQARASKIPIDGTILREKAKMIAAKLNVDYFSAPSGLLSRFKDRCGLVFKKLVGVLMHGWKVCHLYWKFMNHAMYTTQTRRGYSSTCFLIEPWRMKEKLAMEENIPKTDSLWYCVLIVMEVTNKCQL
jgi:hypothetical protein